MKENNLIQLLKNLDRKEMTRFREFSCSPYFNKHKNVRALINYLSHIYPDFTEQRCDRKLVFKEVFPGEQHDQPRLAIIFTYSLRLLEKFLVQEQFNSKTHLHNVLLLKELRQRKQFSFYEKILQNSESSLQKTRYRDSRYYSWQYRLATETDEYFNQIERRKKDISIQVRQNNLDKFFLAEKLKDACEMHVRRKILKVNYAPRLMEGAMEEVEQNLEEYTQVPAILIYFNIYKMVVHTDHRYYFEALDRLQDMKKYFAKPELIDIYNYFQNYCIQQINKGEEQFLGEIFKLYKLELAQGLMIEDGFMSEWHYKNIVTTGIRLREMKWTKAFIDNYRERLRPDSRENAYRFNLASFYYADRQYDKVLDLLIKLEYNDLRYNLGAKALLLRTYYDLGEYDTLHSLTESFKQYLQRNKLMADFRRQGYANLFRLTRRAALLKTNLPFYKREKAQKELKKLNKELETSSAIFNKGWLVEKVRELEQEAGEGK